MISMVSFSCIYSPKIRVCLKLQELASPAWHLAWAWPKVHNVSFHVQRCFSEW
ncbi:hypothetical protein BDA96_02G275600 [Sorghum bicolor]|uniref:Uncharacterized protein n=1 Tax=Sorghum bicolor TaxID=4558 RepID=A0A921RS21_SORBI|nr:hypothetical protein BDA96_02G275600 [Sorghum bicolor]